VSEDKDEQGYSSENQPQITGKDTYRKQVRGSNFTNCPACPEIKLNQTEIIKKIDRIYTALLGADGICLTAGLVKKVTDLETRFANLEATLTSQRKTNASWLNWIRPIVGGVAVVAVTELIVFLVSHHF
jgi:hypothetical protein